MPAPNLPIDFNLIRKTFANTMQTISGITSILEEPESQDYPRPKKPYYSFKLTTPSAKSGDDTTQLVSGTVINRGGVRKMTVSFHCYGNTHEEAYNYMALWQAKLDHFTVQETLRRAGIAVWLIGNVADLSQLLNTGYEGRSQMDVSFGIASNLTEDLSKIDSVDITGTVETDSGTDTLSFTVPEE